MPLWYIAVFFVYAIRRWCLLKRPENLTEAQATKLATLLRYNLRSVKAHLLREAFQRFREYTNPAAAGKFRDEWTAEAMRSRLDPMKKVVRSLRRHRHDSCLHAATSDDDKRIGRKIRSPSTPHTAPSPGRPARQSAWR